ncbi:MAG: cytochrome C oxidase subunit IV family protein [Actinomycetota bacterium]
MSETTTTPDHDVDHAHDDHDDHGHHPTELQYWIVFAALFVLTAVEVLWSYLGLSGMALVLPLLAMMLVKFLLVAGAFMHLYFDMKIINGRLFTWTFTAAIILAMGVYFVVFAAFEFDV